MICPAEGLGKCPTGARDRKNHSPALEIQGKQKTYLHYMLVILDFVLNICLNKLLLFYFKRLIVVNLTSNIRNSILAPKFLPLVVINTFFLNKEKVINFSPAIYSYIPIKLSVIL